MSLRKCDLTGSTDRVEQVHPQIKREGLEFVCFKVGIKLEQLRSEAIAKFSDYQGFDKSEKIQAEINKALKASKKEKPIEIKVQIEKEDEVAKKKKYKKKK